MTDREQYTPGPASGGQVRKDGETWPLILVRELRHPPEKVWQAHGSLGTVGTVKLTTVGAPGTHAILDLEDRLDRRAPTDMFKRFADVGSLCG
jgi:hypothetical protein